MLHVFSINRVKRAARKPKTTNILKRMKYVLKKIRLYDYDAFFFCIMVLVKSLT
jgi:hypothetical protein